MKPAYLLLLTSLVVFSCKKQDAEPELPAETQIGANTFGCRFNGRAWIPDPTQNKPLNNCNDLAFEFEPYRTSGFFSITAINCKKGGYISLFSNVADKSGVYPISASRTINGTAADIGNNDCVYYSSDSDTYCQGSITLTRVDYRAGILSGRFAFTIHKPGCDTLKVTDGRFDLKTN